MQERLKFGGNLSQMVGFMAKIKAIPSFAAGFLVSVCTGRFLFKLALYLVALILFMVSLSVIIDPGELKVVKEIQSLQRVDPIPRAKELAAAEELCQALDYLAHFMEYDYVRENPEALALYDTLKKKRESFAFRTKDAVNGLFYGKGVCPEATVTATVSDFLLIGDVRDLTWGLVNKYYDKEDTDDFTTALAGVGILLWGATVVSIPTAPIHGGSGTVGTVACKASVVLLKLGNKMDKIPKSLKNSILKVLQETKETKNLKIFTPIASSIHKLSKAPGVKVKDAMTILSRCKHVDDLEVLGNAAAVYGKKTGKFLELAGDHSLVVFKKFGNSSQITAALDSAIMRGPKGLALLERVGPDKFMKYLTLSKFSVRGMRSWHEGRLSEAVSILLSYANFMLKKLLSLLPTWAIWALMLVTGLVVFTVPSRGLYRARRWLRSPA